MPTETIVYDDFSFGEFGRLRPWLAPPNSWTGMNMRVYDDGSLGVRSGVRDITPTGLVNGAVWMMNRCPGNNAEVAFGQNNRIRKFFINTVPVQAVTTLTNTLTGTPTTANSFFSGPTCYVVTTTEGAYSFDSTDVATLTGSPDGSSIALHGVRLVISGAPNFSEVRYSEAADYNSWPAANVVIVGDPNGGVAMVKQRDSLLLFKGSEGIFTLTGTLGVNAIIRQTSRFTETGGDTHIGTLASSPDSEQVWFIPTNAGGLTGMPMNYSGAYLSEIDHIPVPFYQDAIVVPMPWRNGGGMVFLGKNPGATVDVNPTLVLQKGAFTRHEFSQSLNISSVAAVAMIEDWRPDPSIPLPSTHSDEDQPGNCLIMTDGGSAGTTPKFYSWPLDMNRPGCETAVTGRMQERAGDNSAVQVSGRFSLPEFHDPNGQEIRVRSVIVDFTSWNTGGSLTNHFDLTVDCIRRWEGDSALTSDTNSYDEAGALLSPAGTQQRRNFSVGQQGKGNGYQLHFTNVRGVSIQRVTVVLDRTPGRF